MSRNKRNTIRLTNIAGGFLTNVELVSDKLGPYIQLIRSTGVNTYTRLCSDVRWSGIVGDDEYFDAPCELEAVVAISGNIYICASLYDGYEMDGHSLGALLRCVDAPLFYYEKQLGAATKPDDIGMSILINVN